jgi:hypothetical protein
MDIKQLGKYTIHEVLGRGGFGTVYRATDNALDREVALKILHPQLMVDMDFIERFRNEAKLVARLEHPNIVTIYDLGEEEGRVFIAMRYLPGGSLRDLLKKNGRIPFGQALEVLRQASSGLSAAHARGLVHRDIKPENILFSEVGQAIITDFGLAKAIQSSSSSSQGGVGTPGYRAPELWRGKPPAGPFTDEYALACVFVEMLTGEQAFSGDTPDEIITKHLLIGAVLPQEWPAGVPEGMNAVLEKALAKEPADRYPGINVFFAALDGLEGEAARRKAAAAQQAALAEAARLEELARQQADLEKKARQEEQARQQAAIEEKARQEQLARQKAALEEKARQEQLARQQADLEEKARLLELARQKAAFEEKTRQEQLARQKAALEEKAHREAQERAQRATGQRTEIIARLQREIETALAGGEWGKARRLIPQLKNLGREGLVLAALLQERLPKRTKPGWVWAVGSLMFAGIVIFLLLFIGRYLLTGIFLAKTYDPVVQATENSPSQPVQTNSPVPVDTIPAATHAPALVKPAETATPAPAAALATPTIPSPLPTNSLPLAVFRNIANVRSGPGTYYPLMSVYPAGSYVEILGRNHAGDWLVFSMPGNNQGWVATSLLQVGFDVMTLNEIQAPPAPIFTLVPTETSASGGRPKPTLAPP